jgi:hypothetical protein
MSPHDISLITWVVLSPLIVWRLVVRFRRLTRRQKLSRVRPWVTLVLFPLLLGVLAMTAFVPLLPPQPMKLLWLAVGLAAGAALGVFGLRRSSFEGAAPDELYYTPDARLGIALTLLFVARLAWRLGHLALAGEQTPLEGLEFALSPYTLVPVGLFSGYFMTYAAGLLLWRRRVRRQR